MQTSSRMAPQQPKNEINTTIEPRVIIPIGKTACGGKPTLPSCSIMPMLFKTMTPKTMVKMPRIDTMALNIKSTYFTRVVPQSMLI
uniref:Uncharacterized protein n=1 Tax=Haematobia irritans TaxID=7368 RepID=A0A1L8E8Z5_HAEIR